jgi:hypothetical protein
MYWLIIVYSLLAAMPRVADVSPPLAVCCSIEALSQFKKFVDMYLVYSKHSIQMVLSVVSRGNVLSGCRFQHGSNTSHAYTPWSITTVDQLVGRSLPHESWSKVSALDPQSSVQSDNRSSIFIADPVRVDFGVGALTQCTRTLLASLRVHMIAGQIDVLRIDIDIDVD